MAGDWIKFELATSDKPEVWEVASLLNIDPDAVVGKLLRVWGWFDQHTENGNAPSVTKKLLDRSVGASGFCDAMIDAGWLIDDGNTITLPNFDRHNGKTAKTRALTAKRVANSKKNKRSSNAGGVTGGNDSGVTNALPREDKREDIKPPPPYARAREDDPPDNSLLIACPEDFGPTKATTGKCHRAGCRRYTSDDIAQFVSHYRAEGKMLSAGGWQEKFLGWMIRQKNYDSKPGGEGHETHQRDSRSRTKRVSDTLDEIARESIERERATGDALDGSDIQENAGEVWPQVDIGD